MVRRIHGVSRPCRMLEDQYRAALPVLSSFAAHQLQTLQLSTVIHKLKLQSSKFEQPSVSAHNSQRRAKARYKRRSPCATGDAVSRTADCYQNGDDKTRPGVKVSAAGAHRHTSYLPDGYEVRDSTKLLPKPGREQTRNVNQPRCLHQKLTFACQTTD
jgi:hypothetical protein